MATITTLNSGGDGATSRGVINTNFANLNTDKLENLTSISYDSSFAANANQGIASDGTYIYSATTSTVYKYNMAGALQTSRDITSDGNYTHVGDLCYHDGYLYVAMSDYPTSTDGEVIKLDASDLSFDSVIATEGDHDGASVARDSNGNFWVVGYGLLNPVKIYKYNSSWAYQASYDLETPDFAGDYGYDGIEWIDGYLFANAHNGSTEGEFVDKYSFDGTTFTRIQRISSVINGKYTGQGISLDPVEADVLWFAARGDSDKAYKTNILTTESVKDTLDDCNNGWSKVKDTWAYASAATITTQPGSLARYKKGDRIKIVQSGTVKYFVLTVVADALLTILVNTDYVLANETITDAWYSHELNPVGFPDWFACAAPTWSITSSIDNGSGAQPENHVIFKQRVVGNTLSGYILTGSCYKSSAGTYGKFTPPVSMIDMNDRTCIGISYIRSNAGTDYTGVVMSYSDIPYFVVNASIPDNTQLDTVSMAYSYEI